MELTKENITEQVETTRSFVTSTTKNVYFATLGAVGLGKDQVVELTNTALERFNVQSNDLSGNVQTLASNMIERGVKLDEEGREILSSTLNRGKDEAADTREKVESLLEKQVTDVLATMNVPSKDDITKLNKKIATLTRKVNDLKKTIEAEKA